MPRGTHPEKGKVCNTEAHRPLDGGFHFTLELTLPDHKSLQRPLRGGLHFIFQSSFPARSFLQRHNIIHAPVEFGMPCPLVKAAFVVGCWERPPLHGQLTDQGWGRFTINIANGLCYQRWKRISATNAGNESRPSTRVRHEIC